jgi:type VI secretion system protein ImpJ
MFLRPQHLQADRRHTQALAARSEKWDLRYNWGLVAIDLELTALANYHLVVRSLQARFRDGTLLSVPEDAVLPEVDLHAAFSRDSTVMVYVAIPLFDLRKANAVAGTSDSARYLVDTLEVEDENTGSDPELIGLRRLNCRLLLGNQEHPGFEKLPIARLVKGTRAQAPPELDVSYIPPVLDCEVYKHLSAGVTAEILEKIRDRIGAIQKTQVEQIQSRGIGFESQAAGDRLIMEQLRTLNEASAALSVLVSVPGFHPLQAYLEVCRVVGQLAIFGRRIGPATPPLPKYDHDDLGGCFFKVKRYTDDLLNDFSKPEYLEEPFTGEGQHIQVQLVGDWLQPAYQMFVGVRTPLDSGECVRLLTQGGLEMKIASAGRVDMIFMRGFRGLRFFHCSTPPRALPSPPDLNLIYFQVERDSEREEWQHVQQELKLAVRLNGITGNIQGERTLTIATGSRANPTTTMQFTLYLLPQGA